MRPIEFVRTQILKVTQSELATIAGVTQPTVSRWERDDDDSEPGLDELALIRTEVKNRGHDWNDAWFFEVPAVNPEAAGAPQ